VAYRLRHAARDVEDKGAAGKQSTALHSPWTLANPRQYPAPLRSGDCATAAEHWTLIRTKRYVTSLLYVRVESIMTCALFN